MLRKITFLLLFATIACCSIAQNFQWAKQIGGISSDKAQCSIYDPSGNIYVVGTFGGTADLDPGPGTFNVTSMGSNDIFVVKLNAIGTFVWGKAFGSSTTDNGQSIALDPSGNIYITGYFYFTVDFDPGVGVTTLTSNGSADAFILKLDGNGNFLWVKQFGGTNIEQGWAITTDPSGNIYTVGNFEYTVDFDPGTGVANLTANGTISDAFVSKLDVNGNYVWAKRLGGPWSEFAYAVNITTAGEVIVVGQFEGTADFDPGTPTYNMVTVGYNPDLFVCKLSATGTFMWAKGVGDSGFDYGYSVGQDGSGNIYVSGIFSFTVDFDPGAATVNMTSNGGSDLYLLKLTSAGNYVWAKQIGNSGNAETARCLSVTPSAVYISGAFDGTVDFNPGGGTYNITALGTQDGHVTKLDLNGNFVSAFGMGAPSSFAIAYHIRADAAGNVYTVGNFAGTTDFAPGPGVSYLTTAGQSDGFVQKLSTCTATSATTSATACSSYTLGSQTYTASGTYTSYIPNFAGCDSVITLNLTIRQPTTATITQDICATSYTLNSQTYTISGTYVQHLTNQAGCDSAITLNLTLRQPTTATINQNVCGTSYTLNSQTYNSSGTYVQHLTNLAGCDSAITLNLTLRQPTSASLTQDVCDTAFSLNGQTYTASGTYQQTLTNTVGCDSILTLNLTLRQPTASSLSQTICGTGFSLNNQTYTSSGTYTQMLTNTVGCDSILTLLLTLNAPSSATLTQTACGSFTLNSQTYTSSGTYTQTLTNNAGCDSTLTLLLTINQPSSSTLVDSACNGYSLNGQSYSASGTYTQNLTNTAGCDSTLTLILTLTTTPVASIAQGNGTLNAGPTGFSYQWLDCDNGMAVVPGANGQTYTPPASGNYAVVVTDGLCSDTSACATFSAVGVAGTAIQGMVLYPNPNDGNFMIRLPEASVATVEITDLLGKIILFQTFPKGQILPIRFEAPAGVYNLRVSTEDALETRTLIRQ